MICRTLNPIATAALVVIAQTSLQAMAQTPAPAEPASTESGVAAENPAGQLKAVTVTAERRVANIQKTSIAMEAIGGAEIAEQGLSSGADILKDVANVEVQGAARGNVIAMRGIGSDLPPGMGESAVSTNYDGVYNFRAEAASLGFFDLSRVEVLRGPQGTLYGRNAAAGAVNFLTRDPELGKLSGNASLEIGSDKLLRSEVGFNLPVNDMVAIRASGASISRDGHLSDGFNDAKANGGRLKVLLKPSNDFKLIVGAERVNLGGKGAGFIPQDNWNDADKRLTAGVGTGANAGMESIGSQDYAATKLWAQADVNLGFATLTVIPASQKAEGILYRKFDVSRPPGAEESFSADPNPAQQKSLEVRLTSNSAPKDVQWVAGAYYYDMLNQQTCLAFCETAAPDTRDTTTSKAVFGQTTLPLNERTRLVGGLRYTKDNKTTISGASGDWNSTDGKIALEYDVSPAAMAYANLASAYRPGGFNSFSTPPVKFEQEKLRSLELGFKSRWMENTLQFNGALFRYDYKDYQAIDFQLINGAPVANFINVPSQSIQGVEGEVQYLLPGEAGKLRAAATFLDATFGELTVGGVNLKGEVMPHAPRMTIKLGYDYPMSLSDGSSVTLSADLRHTSKQYVSINENANTLQPAYSKVDLSANYRSADDRWGVNFYVKNATNYVAKTANFAGFTMVSAPRTFGAVLSTQF